MPFKQNSSKNPSQKEINKEEIFNIYLPALISGVNAFGQEFQENTDIFSISYKKTSFLLETKVTIGTQLNVIMDIPKTICLNHALKLFISGNVFLIELKSDKKKSQYISILLNKNYQIRSFP
ncbi:MAG: hypothetical protein ACOC5F_05600 [Candidatus Aminicenantaceae bacterium]